MAAVLSLVLLALACPLASAFDGNVVSRLDSSSGPICQKFPTEAKNLSSMCREFTADTFFLTFGDAETTRNFLKKMKNDLEALGSAADTVIDNTPELDHLDGELPPACETAMGKYWCKSFVPQCTADGRSVDNDARAICAEINRTCGANAYAGFKTVLGVCSVNDGHFSTAVNQCVSTDSIAQELDDAVVPDCEQAVKGRRVSAAHLAPYRIQVAVGAFHEASLRHHNGGNVNGTNCTANTGKLLCTPPAECSTDGRSLVDNRKSSDCLGFFECFKAQLLQQDGFTQADVCPATNTSTSNGSGSGTGPGSKSTSNESSASTAVLSASTFLSAVVYMLCKNLLF